MTTSMFVEIVIIGLIIAIILLLGAVAFIGYDYIIAFIALNLPFGSSVLAVGILYALGIICDRISDYVTIPIEKKYRVKYGFSLKGSVIITEKNRSLMEFMNFVRSKMRVLRSCIVFLPFLLLASCSVFVRYSQQWSGLFWLTMIAEVLLWVFSGIGYISTLKTYYSRACTISHLIGESNLNNNTRA